MDISKIVDLVRTVNSAINGVVWGPPMLILLIGTGVYLTIRTKFLALGKLGYVLKNTLFKMFDKTQKGEGEISAFEAVSTALAATVGTGNIAGVATAIALGGPGAVFWMWMAAIIGMTTKFAEVVLAIQFREKTPDGRFVGGPMYYISKGIKGNFGKILAVIFSIFGAFAAFGIGNLVQSNSISAGMETSFGMTPWIVGIVTAGAVALVIIGGIKRIGTVSSYLVPIMAAFYILGALVILAMNITAVPAAFALIVKTAFKGTAVIGGAAGVGITQAIRFGVARGVFTNEAGLGSAPIAHATATTDHPVRQGLWGIFEVFMDTIVICSMTALVIITSGEWQGGLSGAALTVTAFSASLGTWGGYIVSVGGALFAFSTILGWEYYGERCIEYLAGPKLIWPYRIVFIPFIVVGATGGLQLMWSIADTLNGLMAIPNLIGVAVLSGVVIKSAKEFFSTPSLRG